MTLQGPSSQVLTAALGTFGDCKESEVAFPDTFVGDIMAEVEAILSSKADSLWRRGQAEIGKLHEERKEALSCLQELTARQDVLLAEQSTMRSALSDITMKLESVATEMREALRAAPGSYDLTELLASDGLRTRVQASMVPLMTPGQPASIRLPPLPPTALNPTVAPLSFRPESGLLDRSDGPRTPPRNTEQARMAGFGGLSGVAGAYPGSPAVMLSLASALNASDVTPPPIAAPTAPAKRLQIAECLDMDHKLYEAPYLVPPFLGSDPVSIGLVEEPRSTPTLNADALAWSPPQLRAEAPAFVPGAGILAHDDDEALKPRRLL